MSTASTWRRTSDFSPGQINVPDHLSTVWCCASTGAKAGVGVGSEKALLVRPRGQSFSAGSSAGRLAGILGGIFKLPGLTISNNVDQRDGVAHYLPVRVKTQSPIIGPCGGDICGTMAPWV